MIVRAKYRCMSITNRWDGTTEIEFQPVTNRTDNEENCSFWKYTPAGAASLTYWKGHEAPFGAGDYYYIDIEQDDEGLWCLDKNVDQGERLDVHLGTNWLKPEELGGIRHGKFEASIDNPSGAAPFRDQVGTKWSVAFIYAEPSDD
jgi:hypothetical protein